MKIRFVVSVFAAIACFVCAFYTGAAQESQERVVKRLPIEHGEPIAITDIKVNDKSISFDKKFPADDNWLSSLAVSIKNSSDKRILFTSIQLQFTRPARSPGNMSVDDIFYGNWALQMRPPTQDEKLVGIAPAETAAISMTAQKFLELKRFLAETGFPDSIERVDIRINSVIFEDDSMWTRGKYLRRDPNNPGSWKSSTQLTN